MLFRSVKDDVLDTDAFSKFVDDEIKDFEDAGMTKTILGRGSSLDKETESKSEEETKLEKDDDAQVDQMLKMSGQLVEKEE